MARTYTESTHLSAWQAEKTTQEAQTAITATMSWPRMHMYACMYATFQGWPEDQ